MKWWFFINYKIFEFYENTSESMPALYSASVSAVLIQLNILTIHFFIYKWAGIKILFHVSIVIIVYVFMLLLNYFTIYKEKKYVRIFKEMEKLEEKNKNFNLFFFIYFYLTIFTTFSWVIYSIIEQA